jgi:phage gp36-like protein
MSFLRSRDYLPQIQTTILSQITKGDPLVQADAEEDAQEEISSYLRQRFDLTIAFSDTVVFDPTATYDARQLVELNYTAWVNQNYTAGALVSYTDGNAYLCTTNTVSDAPPSNTTYWALLGTNYGLYNIPVPYPVFDVNKGNYHIGDIVYWKNKIYKCLIPSQGYDHTALIQFEAQQNIPLLNVFPDDAIHGATYWGIGTVYNVANLLPQQTAQNTTAWLNTTTYSQNELVSLNNKLWQSLVSSNTGNTPGTDIINWQPVAWAYGDNRDRSLVKNMVDVTLYTLHANIAPQNIPALRQRRYEKAIEWCLAVAKGDVTPSLPMLQPTQGSRIRIGGNIKLENTW